MPLAIYWLASSYAPASSPSHPLLHLRCTRVDHSLLRSLRGCYGIPRATERFKYTWSSSRFASRGANTDFFLRWLVYLIYIDRAFVATDNPGVMSGSCECPDAATQSTRMPRRRTVLTGGFWWPPSPAPIVSFAPRASARPSLKCPRGDRESQ